MKYVLWKRDLSSLALKTAGLSSFTLRTQEISLCSLQRGLALIWGKYYEKKGSLFATCLTHAKTEDICSVQLAGAPALENPEKAFSFLMIKTDIYKCRVGSHRRVFKRGKNQHFFLGEELLMSRPWEMPGRGWHTWEEPRSLWKGNGSRLYPFPPRCKLNLLQ